jgi:hypothetical protein
MLKAVEGIYRDGTVQLAEQLPGIGEARVIVTFLPEKLAADAVNPWLAVSGSLPSAQVDEMLAAIEEGCEKVDPETWDVPC